MPSTPPVDPYRDYGYTDAAPNPSHAYLWPAIHALLQGFYRHPEGQAMLPRALDIGCGNGFLCTRLAKIGFEVSGFDRSQQGIAHARTALPTNRFEVLAVGESPQSVFGKDWDVVISTEVIEHLYAPRQLLADAYTMLRVGGLLILTTPYHGYLKNLLLALTGRMDRHFTALWDGGHIKFFSPRTISVLLQEAGFEVLAVRGAGRVPWLWASMAIAARKPAPLTAADGACKSPS